MDPTIPRIPEADTMNGPVRAKSVSFQRPVCMGIRHAFRLAPTHMRAKGGPQLDCRPRLPGGMGTVNATRGAPDPPRRSSSGPWLRRDGIGGHGPVRQPMHPPPDRAHLAARYRRGGVPATPSDTVAGRHEGGLGTALDSRHQDRGCVPGLEPEQQVNSIREGSHADRLGVETPAQRDHVALDDGGRVGRYEGNPAKGRPHEVTVQLVGCPAGNVVDHVHVRYVGRPLIGRSSRVRRPRCSPVSSCVPESRKQHGGREWQVKETGSARGRYTPARRPIWLPARS